MVVTELGISMLVRLEQSLNAHSPMLVTELGMVEFLHPTISVLLDVSIIALQFLRLSYTGFPASTVMLVRLEQPLNALYPMLVTELGMVMLVRLEQSLNANSPMLVTELGMVMLVRLVRP